MLTYSIDKNDSYSLYEQLYSMIKSDILSGKLKYQEKLPSKRAFAEHLNVSIITVKNAYEQLIAEGYIYTVEKKGYFVCKVERPLQGSTYSDIPSVTKHTEWFMDFVTNAISAEYFPFTVWSRFMRQTILDQGDKILKSIPYNGAYELRKAIVDYLQQFRGLSIDPEQVIIGAGTEFLYHIIIELLGRDKTYAVEDPGYNKISYIYHANDVHVEHIPLDGNGLSVKQLRLSSADVVHISPSHHYPTGQIMPIGRRQELLSWAADHQSHYILEDDYDSEFRFVGRPIPTLFSIDQHDKVIYMNTFSKTIAPSIRISYMILPKHLLARYREKLSFYTCTVSGFEQYTLAKFISEGRYEQHLNRIRTRYRQKREAVIDLIENGPLQGHVKVINHDTGLHFLVSIDTSLSDETLKEMAAVQGLRIALLSDYYQKKTSTNEHYLVVNYSGINVDLLPEALERLSHIITEEHHV